jgi:hypothetical protein
MYRYLFSTAVAILMLSTVTHAQDSTHPSEIRSSDVFALGLGFGQDFGGFGYNLIPFSSSIGYKVVLN